MGSNYFDGITAPLGKKNCVRADVVFDRYEKADSRKEGERVRRGAIAGFEVKISGLNSPVPKKNHKMFGAIKIFSVLAYCLHRTSPFFGHFMNIH